MSVNKVMADTHLFDLLRIAAEASTATITVYPLGETTRPIKKSYKEIIYQAQKNAKTVLQIDGISQYSKLLLHFDQHLENIEWLLPVMSPPLVSDHSQRRKHLIHLHDLLRNPVVLTKANLVPNIESLGVSTEVKNHWNTSGIQGKYQNHTAVLMLTSGSTGNAKAVNLSHRATCQCPRSLRRAIPPCSHRPVPNSCFDAR